MGKRSYYSEESKCKALELCLNSSQTIKEIAGNLGTSSYNLSGWKREYSDKDELAFPGQGKQKLTSEQEEIQQLKKKLMEARMERDILKKAMVLSVKEKAN